MYHHVYNRDGRQGQAPNFLGHGYYHSAFLHWQKHAVPQRDRDFSSFPLCISCKCECLILDANLPGSSRDTSCKTLYTMTMLGSDTVTPVVPPHPQQPEICKNASHIRLSGFRTPRHVVCMLGKEEYLYLYMQTPPVQSAMICNHMPLGETWTPA